MSASRASAIPQYVGVRFVAVCLGYGFKEAQAALHSVGLRGGPGRLYDWVDVEDALGRRFISYDAIEAIAAHVDASSTTRASYEVSQQVYDLVLAAWHAKGLSPHGVVRARARPAKAAKKRGRPAKIDGAKAANEARERIAAQQALNDDLTRERLTGQREQNEVRRLQAKRLAGQMCDRLTVRQRSSEIANSVQRFIAGMPARISGYLTQTTAITDEEVRIIEQMLQDEVPMFIKELKRDIEKIDKDGAEVASAKRYGERSSSDMLEVA